MPRRAPLDNNKNATDHNHSSTNTDLFNKDRTPKHSTSIIGQWTSEDRMCRAVLRGCVDMGLVEKPKARRRERLSPAEHPKSNISISISISISLSLSLSLFIHIYIYRERERCIHVYIYIYMCICIYIYIERERERDIEIHINV